MSDWNDGFEEGLAEGKRQARAARADTPAVAVSDLIADPEDHVQRWEMTSAYEAIMEASEDTLRTVLALRPDIRRRLHAVLARALIDAAPPARRAEPDWERLYVEESERYVRLSNEVAARRAEDGLDAAWAEAEAALPDKWSLLVGDSRRSGKDGWWATASEPFDEARRGFRVVSTSEQGELYATPAEALRAVAARLSASDGATEGA